MQLSRVISSMFFCQSVRQGSLGNKIIDCLNYLRFIIIIMFILYSAISGVFTKVKIINYNAKHKYIKEFDSVAKAFPMTHDNHMIC